MSILTEQEQDALVAQVELLTCQLNMVEGRVNKNEQAIHLMVESSVATGIQRAVADPKTWDAFFQALSNRARDQAGEVAVGGIKWVGTKLLWATVAAVVIYMIGGWSLLVKAVAGFTH